MKKSIFLASFVCLLLSCNSKLPEPKKIDVLTENESIQNVLDSWHLNAAQTDFKSYFGAMTKDGVFVGTDVSEVWTVQEFKDFSKPFFDRGKAWSFKAVDRNIYINEDSKIAWFDEVLETWMGVCRGSGVLKKNNDTWEIAHYVLSLTIPNENIQEVMKVNKQQDSLYLKKMKKFN